MKKLVVLKNIYRDSFDLMLLSDRIRDIDGVTDAAILIGTRNNKNRLESLDYSGKELQSATNNDICVGIDYNIESGLKNAEQEINAFMKGIDQLSEKTTDVLGFKPQSVESAKKFMPAANLVSISLPGEFAAKEAGKSLALDLNVFLFSDNVSIEDEIELKKEAESRNLLLMGPDCGTALIHGYPLGFCNIISRGPVGIVAASGTGAQEVMCLLDHQGIGVSHVIGTGGRDLSADIGGTMTRMGLKALNQDNETEVIILVSKPADSNVEKEIEELSSSLDKPVIGCFIGEAHSDPKGKKNWYRTGSLNQAASMAASLFNNKPFTERLTFADFNRKHSKTIKALRDSMKSEQRYLRGLYSGGTLADEAAALLAELIPQVHAGDGFGMVLPIKNWGKSEENTLLDLGDDRFTQGRPHPMIDPGTRLERLKQEAADPQVAVVILDMVLGTNTLEDPAATYIPAIKQVKEKTNAEGRNLIIIVHTCGSQKDTGNFPVTQAQRFKDAGCLVFETNEEAAYMAGSILQ